jgi:hypothetical protein
VYSTQASASSGKQLPTPQAGFAGGTAGGVAASGAPEASAGTVCVCSGVESTGLQLSPLQLEAGMAASSTEQATTEPTPVSSANVSLHKRGIITGTLK